MNYENNKMMVNKNIDKLITAVLFRNHLTKIDKDRH